MQSSAPASSKYVALQLPDNSFFNKRAVSSSKFSAHFLSLRKSTIPSLGFTFEPSLIVYSL